MTWLQRLLAPDDAPRLRLSDWLRFSGRASKGEFRAVFNPLLPSPWMGEGSGMGVAPLPQRARASAASVRVSSVERTTPTPGLSPIQGERSYGLAGDAMFGDLG